MCSVQALHSLQSFIIKTDEEGSRCVQLSVGIYLKGAQTP